MIFLDRIRYFKGFHHGNTFCLVGGLEVGEQLLLVDIIETRCLHLRSVMCLLTGGLWRHQPRRIVYWRAAAKANGQASPRAGDAADRTTRMVQRVGIELPGMLQACFKVQILREQVIIGNRGIIGDRARKYGVYSKNNEEGAIVAFKVITAITPIAAAAETTGQECR